METKVKQGADNMIKTYSSGSSKVHCTTLHHTTWFNGVNLAGQNPAGSGQRRVTPCHCHGAQQDTELTDLVKTDLIAVS